MRSRFSFILLLFSFSVAWGQTLTESVMLENFESGRISFADSIVLMGKARWDILDNPAKNAVNSSEKVYRFERIGKDPEWAGFWVQLTGKTTSIDADQYRYIHIKYLRTNDRSRLRIKLQKGKGNAREFFSTRPSQKLNDWEWMTFDLKKNNCKGIYPVFSVQPDVSTNQPIGTVAYVDDILLTNDPEPYLSFSEKTVQGLVVENKDAHSLQIAWEPVIGAVSYVFSNNGKEIGKTKIPTTILSGFYPDSQQNLQVFALNSHDERTNPSAIVIANTLKQGKLEAPKKLHFTLRDSTSVELEWDPVLGADSYEVYKDGQMHTTTTCTQIKWTDLASYKPFVFTVCATNSKGDRSGQSKITVATLETAQQRANRMSWWHHDRFGLFVHWGVYAAFAGCYENRCLPVGEYGEWIMSKMEIPVDAYKEKAKTDFTAAAYDPDFWVAMAKKAGMKYIVLTSKHHDGFALFDSKVSEWNAVQASPAGRDLLEPLVKAAHEAGLKVGFYYSQALDWVNGGSGKHWDKEQDKRTFDQYIEEVSLPQVREILKNYGKIDLLWWDMPIEMTDERAARFLELLAEEFNWTKDLIINDRLGGSYKFDHNTPEQSIPDMPANGRSDGRDWETCMTLNETWGYRWDDHGWKSSEEIIHKLTDIVSKGGNFLLNVGPMADGTIPLPSVARLDSVGQWMQINGEAIYGTSHSPFTEQLPWGRCTQKISENNHQMYFHIWDWPQDGKLFIPGMQNLPEEVYLLMDKAKKLKVTKESKGLTVVLPKNNPEKYSVTLVFKMKN